MDITAEQLFAIIGEQEVQIRRLRAEVMGLRQRVEELTPGESSPNGVTDMGSVVIEEESDPIVATTS